MNYEDFVAAKLHQSQARGLETHAPLWPSFYPFQADLVRWALRRGRAAIFADTGLGKGLMLAEWARQVSAIGRVMVVAPLAVAEQLVREAAKLGVEMSYERDDTKRRRIVVTNYEMVDHFDTTEFVGVVLDESSILKAYDGATRTLIIERFRETRFRLACTATPAPNDFTELGNHAEFLGVKSRVEMLSEFFVHDSSNTRTWRLKGHAEEAFWRWCCTWGAFVRRPSDLGYDDGEFVLPELRVHEHVVHVDPRDAWASGKLMAHDARTLADQRATRRSTMGARIEKAAELAIGDEPCIVWAELNDEADAATAAIPGAVQVKGSDSPEEKRDRLLGFADGAFRVLVTKMRIAGFGMNYQHCARMVFVGATHSYEQQYQAIRRCWRFGQTRPVDVHVIRAETDGAIVDNYRRKELEAQRLAERTARYVVDAVRSGMSGSKREWDHYEPLQVKTLPDWLKRRHREIDRDG